LGNHDFHARASSLRAASADRRHSISLRLRQISFLDWVSRSR
jgi:hypothetical protein